MREYSLSKGLIKTVVNLVVVAGPLVVGLLPTELANMTLSAVLLLLINFLKVKYS